MVCVARVRTPGVKSRSISWAAARDAASLHIVRVEGMLDPRQPDLFKPSVLEAIHTLVEDRVPIGVRKGIQSLVPAVARVASHREGPDAVPRSAGIGTAEGDSGLDL